LLDLTKCWDIQPAFKVGDRVKSMEWGLNPRLMVIKTLDGIYACRKTLLRHKFRDGFAVVQTGVDSLVIEQTGDIDGNTAKLRTQLQILGLDFSKGNLLVYDGFHADIYKVSDTCDVMEAGSFESASRAMAIHNDSIFRAAEGRIEVLTHSGTIKQTLAFDEPMHGTPLLLDICRDYLAAVTSLK
jgi:intraflagellar transport protein 140